MEHHKEIVEYFNDRGVSIIFLFRRNLLRRMVSDLANSYDRYAKLLNGRHKSHVHSHEEVSPPAPISSPMMTNIIKITISLPASCRLIHFRHISQRSI